MEGAWSSNLTSKASVRDLLELLEKVDGIPFIHRPVDTVEGLLDALRRWNQRQYDRYALGYFAFHGEPGRIQIGRRSVSLEELEKILYFGSCSVLRVPAGDLDAFCDLSGSPCIIGFTRDVDWLESAALDLILLDAIARRRDPSGVREWLIREFRGLADRLGLRVCCASSFAGPQLRC